MSVLQDPEYWRKRAAQTRAKVTDARWPKPRIDLLRVAEEYDRLAARAEASQITQSGPAEDVGLRDLGV